MKTSHDFDAAVVAKNQGGKVRIVKKHEQPTRHGAAVGLGWGLAVGVVSALFPPAGIGLVAVYEANLADQVAANIKAANRVASKVTDMEADQLAADLKQAEQETRPCRHKAAATSSSRRRRAVARRPDPNVHPRPPHLPAVPMAGGDHRRP